MKRISKNKCVFCGSKLYGTEMDKKRNWRTIQFVIDRFKSAFSEAKLETVNEKFGVDIKKINNVKVCMSCCNNTVKDKVAELKKEAKQLEEALAKKREEEERKKKLAEEERIRKEKEKYASRFVNIWRDQTVVKSIKNVKYISHTPYMFVIVDINDYKFVIPLKEHIIETNVELYHNNGSHSTL